MNKTTGTENKTVDTSTGTLTGKQKRELNLRSLSDLDSEKRKEIARLGGLARQEQVRQRKSMKEQLISFLDSQVSKETATKYLGQAADGLKEDDLTYQGILGAKMWQEAVVNGNAKAAEFCRDTSGQKPRDEISLSADIMSAGDRALMADIAARLGILPKENDQ